MNYLGRFSNFCISDTQSSLRCSKDSSGSHTHLLGGLAPGGSLGAEPPRTMTEAESVRFRNPGKEGPGPRGLEQKALSGSCQAGLFCRPLMPGSMGGDNDMFFHDTNKV